MRVVEAKNMHSVENLRTAWGQYPLAFDYWLVDPGDIPVDIASLESLLDKLLMRKQLRVRQSPQTPGGETPSIVERLLQEKFKFKGALEQTLRNQNLHVQTLHMESLGGPYQDFVDRFASYVGNLDGTSAQSELKIQAGLFIASPKAVVRFHADGSHNFLIHLAGNKQAHVYANDDSRLVNDAMRERIFGGGNRYLDYSTDLESSALIADLKPGMSCYIPPLCAHWLQGFEDITISLAVSISTQQEERLKKIHTMNRRLRAVGFSPSAVGEIPHRDAIKESTERVLERGVGNLKKWRASLRKTGG